MSTSTGPRQAVRAIHHILIIIASASCGGTNGYDSAAQPGEPLAGLGDTEAGQFLLGKAVFERLVVPDEGLGPLFNADRCSACHDEPATGGSGSLLVHKATRFENGVCDLLEAEGGDNIQQRATPALMQTGIRQEAEPARANGRARMTAPPLFGLGLMEAIPEARILAQVDESDGDGDGVSGRAGRTQTGRLGRFGRKADVATVLEFIDTALRFEVGLTTSLNPREETLNGSALPVGVDPMPEPEIDERGLTLLTHFAMFLAPPSREAASGASADSIDKGRRLFEAIRCTACHTPTLRTDDHSVEALNGREAHLYSDLLLHDLGPELADVCAPHALPSEWRTAPLWGLRFRSRHLHDGRADSPREAILLHAGEGEGARRAFNALDSNDQRLLLRFLASL